MGPLILALVLLCGPTLAWAGPITPLQWLATALVPGTPGYYASDVEYPERPVSVAAMGGHVQLGPAHAYGLLGERFPYVVPAGMWLILTDVNFGSKQIVTRNSYLILDDLVIVPSGIGHWGPRVPLIALPGTFVNAQIMNNSPEGQWITVTVAGFLLPQVPGETYSAALRRAMRALTFPED